MHIGCSALKLAGREEGWRGGKGGKGGKAELNSQAYVGGMLG